MLIRTYTALRSVFRNTSRGYLLPLGRGNALMRSRIAYGFSTDPKQPIDQTQNKHQKTEKEQEQQPNTEVDQGKKEVVEMKEEVPEEIKEPVEEKKSFGKAAWDYLSNSWRHTFPDEEYEVKRLQEQRRVSIKETALKAQIAKEEAEAAAAIKAEEEAAAQLQLENNNALLNLNDQKQGEIIKEKKHTKRFDTSLGGGTKGIAGFNKESEPAADDGIGLSGYFGATLSQGIKTGGGKIGKGAENLISMITDNQTISKAAEEMRRIDGKFETTELEVEAKYLFVTTYNDFLKGKYESFERVCSDQGYEYFKTQRNIMKARNIRPYNLNLIDVSSLVLKDATSGQGATPSFTFWIVAQDIYCYYDNKDGKIVEGDPTRIHSVTFQFSIRFSQSQMDSTGQPWEIVEVRKLQELAMLY